jgi:carboxyl-terminal processing protease
MKQLQSTPLLLIVLLPLFATAQSTIQTANEAFVLTRMVQKFHLEPKPVNDAFSAELLDKLLKESDNDKIYFLQSDIAQFKLYTTKLDDEINNKQTNFLNLFINIYQQRLKQADSLADVITKKPFDFTIAEKITIKEDTSYPATIAAMKDKIYKQIKHEALEALVDDAPYEFEKATAFKQKKFLDSAAVFAVKKAGRSFKRSIEEILQNPSGSAQFIGNMYCKCIAVCFDPHTEYFPPVEKEDFDAALGKQPFRFGFKLKEDKDEGVVIDNLEPGSPAFKSGQLNKGDKIQSIQWEGKQTVDVSGDDAKQVSELLSLSNHDKMKMTVKKSDGTTAQVTLNKEQDKSEEDEDKVKSFLIKGDKTYGYIYLPAFYEDWESKNNNVKGCANDVATEIIKLKKENIDGLILDLRYNGGGSVQEAIELSGIFIDAGPVAQYKTTDPKIYTFKDVNRGTIYDGPMIVMVNRYSASASEMVAGTLQDYHRAIIVGSPTYGKATGQNVFPMDTTVTYETLDKKQSNNYIKITMSKLYRLTGATAQANGVIPDIELPDLLNVYGERESDEPTALPATPIDANKYYRPYTAVDISAVKTKINNEVKTDPYFNYVQHASDDLLKEKQPRDVSLRFADALALEAEDDHADPIDSLKQSYRSGAPFTITNNKSELERLKANEYLNELNDDFKEAILADPYIRISYKVLTQIAH